MNNRTVPIRALPSSRRRIFGGICAGLFLLAPVACDANPPAYTITVDGRPGGETVHVTVIAGGRTLTDKDVTTPYAVSDRAYRIDGTVAVRRLDNKPGPLSCVVKRNGYTYAHNEGNGPAAIANCAYALR